MKWILGGIAALGLAAVGCGRCHGDKLEYYSGKIVKRLASKLDLDEAQKGKLEAVRATILAKHSEMKGKGADDLAGVLTLIRAEKLDKAKVNQMIDEHQKTRQEVKDKLIDQVADFHDSLKPEQREKLAKLVEDKAKCYLK